MAFIDIPLGDLLELVYLFVVGSRFVVNVCKIIKINNLLLDNFENLGILI